MTTTLSGNTTVSYADHLDAVAEAAVQPFTAWVASGYASGFVDLPPKLVRSPLTRHGTFTRALAEVFVDLDPGDGASCAEAEARTQFLQQLLPMVMQRENDLHDAYFRQRARGMAHRTAALIAAMTGCVTAAINLPAVPASLLTACVVVVLVSVYLSQLRRSRSWHAPPDSAARLLDALPWRTGVAGVLPGY